MKASHVPSLRSKHTTELAAMGKWVPPSMVQLPSDALVLAHGIQPLTVDRGSLDRKTEAETSDMAVTLDQIFAVVEVDQAEFFVGNLFRRRFHTDSFPREPRHFVAFAVLPDGSLLSLGYVHYTIWEGCALCGGLVIDDRHYRRLPSNTRQSIHRAGGVAELLLRQSFLRMPESTLAIWGHVGNKQSEAVCLRVGFQRTASDYIMVVWRDSNFSEAEKQAWIERVVALGPF